jgi:hypothetical protein
MGYVVQRLEMGWRLGERVTVVRDTDAAPIPCSRPANGRLDEGVGSIHGQRAWPCLRMLAFAGLLAHIQAGTRGKPRRWGDD